MEYVAIFMAVLFPGALVALNYDLLENLPLFSMLRIYCAGIWHNVIVSYPDLHELISKSCRKHLFSICVVCHAKL